MSHQAYVASALMAIADYNAKQRNTGLHANVRSNTGRVVGDSFGVRTVVFEGSDSRQTITVSNRSGSWAVVSVN